MVTGKIKILLLVVIFVVASWVIWTMLKPPDDRELVLRQLKYFRTNSSKYSGEGTTQALVKSKSLETIFAGSCRIDVNVDFINGTFTPEEIAGKAIYYRRFFESAVIDLSDIKVDIAGSEHATATMTASLDGILKNNKRISEFRNLQCNFKKTNKKWLITAIDFQPILEK